MCATRALFTSAHLLCTAKSRAFKASSAETLSCRRREIEKKGEEKLRRRSKGGDNAGEEERERLRDGTVKKENRDGGERR
jgi:hypothetical protein